MSCNCECRPSCPYSEWLHPLCCNPAHFCCAGWENGPTLVIHKIVLEPCGNQSCTERTFTLRITGPSYPNGEIFTLRAGSCTQLDEPLVISGLEPGCCHQGYEQAVRILHDHHRTGHGQRRPPDKFLRATVVTIVTANALPPSPLLLLILILVKTANDHLFA
ncbi:MAG: hypothetical protein ACLS7Z_03165 [Christensenellales bacterium]